MSEINIKLPNNIKKIEYKFPLVFTYNGQLFMTIRRVCPERYNIINIYNGTLQRNIDEPKLYEGKTFGEIIEILNNDWQSWKEVNIKIEAE